MGAPGSGYDGQAEDGRAIYKWLAASLGGDDAASKFLQQELDIPGIRYLDGSSRGAGEGTYNYVTFDPSRIKVLERK